MASWKQTKSAISYYLLYTSKRLVAAVHKEMAKGPAPSPQAVKVAASEKC